MILDEVDVGTLDFQHQTILLVNGQRPLVLDRGLGCLSNHVFFQLLSQ